MKSPSEDEDSEPSETKEDAESDDESESEGEDEENSSDEQYFTNKRYKNNRHLWLVGSQEYLSRPSSGSKKKPIKLQHASQVQMLLEHIDPRR